MIVSPIVFNAITVGLIIWTTTYSIRRGRAMRKLRTGQLSSPARDQPPTQEDIAAQG